MERGVVVVAQEVFVFGGVEIDDSGTSFGLQQSMSAIPNGHLGRRRGCTVVWTLLAR